MTTQIVRYCEVCGEEVLRSEGHYYNKGDGEEYLDEIDGEYIDGAGECEECGRLLCADCGGFENKVCRECQEEYEEGPLPDYLDELDDEESALIMQEVAV